VKSVKPCTAKGIVKGVVSAGEGVIAMVNGALSFFGVNEVPVLSVISTLAQYLPRSVFSETEQGETQGDSLPGSFR
jgi:hypothetical protein